jgi:PIN domain nuclease of toxin-antitoxin system
MVANHNHAGFGLSQKRQQAPPAQAPPQENPGDPMVGNNVTPTAKGDLASKGVIRNLLNGHFKGVADVRLRIVHKQELTELNTSQVKNILAQPHEILDELQSDLEKLMSLETELPLESDLAKKIAAMGQRVAELSQGDELKVAEAKAVIEDLKTELANLLNAIGAYLKQDDETAVPGESVTFDNIEVQADLEGSVNAPPMQEQVNEPDAAASDKDGFIASETGINLILSDFLAKWQADAIAVKELPEKVEAVDDLVPAQETESIESAPSAGERLAAELDAMAERLDQATLLPPLSPAPENHGAAYYKFLNMLNDNNAYQTPGAMLPGQNTIPQIDSVV